MKDMSLWNYCRVPDTEWSFQDGGLYIVKKVGYLSVYKLHV